MTWLLTWLNVSVATLIVIQREIVSRQKGNLETDLVVKFIGNSKVRKRTESSCMVLVEETRTLKTCNLFFTFN